MLRKSLKEKCVFYLGVICFCIALITTIYYTATITQGTYQSDESMIECYQSECFYENN